MVEACFFVKIILQGSKDYASLTIFEINFVEMLQFSDKFQAYRQAKTFSFFQNGIFGNTNGTGNVWTQSFPANIYLFKVNNKSLETSVKYVQS